MPPRHHHPRAVLLYRARTEYPTRSPLPSPRKFQSSSASGDVGGSGGAEFHGFRGAAQLPRSRMLGRLLRVVPPAVTPSSGAGGPSVASIRAVSAGRII
ncbi:hypothetical protein ABZP36_026265 [Zizania latifolia]